MTTLLIEITAYNKSLIYVSTDIDTGYLICPYIDFDMLSPEDVEKLKHTCVDVTLYKWYKFYISEEIPQQIGDLELFDPLSHLVFDSIVTECVPVADVQSIHCKYVFPCSVSRLDNGLEHMNKYKDMFRLNGGDISADNFFNMINLWNANAPWYQLQCFIDDNGEKFIINESYLHGTIEGDEFELNEDCVKAYLGIYYDDLVKYLVRLPELDEEMSDGTVRCYFGISLNDFSDIVDELMK